MVSVLSAFKIEEWSEYISYLIGRSRSHSFEGLREIVE